MKYDIYFHNDFDGRASAAIMLAFLRERGDDIEHFTSVNYYLLPEWLHEDFFERHKLFRGVRNPAIIVDFLYHPAAVWWFEHHPTTFKKLVWQKRFRSDKQHHLKPEYPSCTHLVADALTKNFGWKPPKHIKELVKWLDVIDGARYLSAKQTIEVREPALQVNEYIELQRHSKAANKNIITMLATMPLAGIARRVEVKRFVAAIKKRQKRGIAFTKKHTHMVGHAAFIDRTGVKLDFPHFVSPYLFPKTEYFVRLSNRDGLYHINVGRSPWMRHRKRRIDVGVMLKEFGGGGHLDVGGVEFKTHEEALFAANSFMETINSSKRRS